MSINKSAMFLFFCVATITILLLSALNIENYLTPKEVLGIKTEDNTDKFWTDFLSKNPNYIPGWIEMGRLDETRKIDPNYEVR